MPSGTTLNRLDVADAAGETPISHRVREVWPITEPVNPKDHVGVSAPTEGAGLGQLRRRERTYQQSLAVADSLAALGATLVACVAAGASPVWLMTLTGPFGVAVAKVHGLYDRDDKVIRKTNLTEWRTLVEAAGVTAMGIFWALPVLTRGGREDGLRSFLLLGGSVLLFEISLRALARLVARWVTDPERCVIVGQLAGTAELERRLRSRRGVELVGTVSEDRLTGSAEELVGLIEELGVHRLVLAPSSEADVCAVQLLQAAEMVGLRVSIVPNVMTTFAGLASVEELDGMPLYGAPRFGLSRSSLQLKRAFDLIVATAALVVLSPLMLLIAVWIRLDSQGPVLFRQTRIGHHAKPFKILKFRSMIDGADAMKQHLLERNEAAEGLFKIAQDPRVTRVGRHLRSAHLDELPQLLNVLRGEMSLVGPRPLVAEEDARVSGRNRYRAHLVPGMTGPWQVKGPLRTPLAEMAVLDLRYASNWSMWTDLSILLRTGLRVLARGGS